MAEALGEAGFGVLDGVYGAAGMALFDVRSADICSLVTDIQLGNGPRGWDVARHCRQVVPALPVVYVTGDSSGDWSAEGVPESVMITKPFVMAQLITALSTLLDKAPAVPQRRSARRTVLRELSFQVGWNGHVAGRAKGLAAPRRLCGDLRSVVLYADLEPYGRRAPGAFWRSAALPAVRCPWLLNGREQTLPGR